MGARSRRKGAAWERELAQRFREAGIPAERSLTEVRDGNTGDLDLPRHVPLTVQAKVGKQPRIYDALLEAEEAAGPGQHPVAIVRRNGSGSRPPTDMAILPLEDFFELVEQLRACGAWR